MVTQYRFTLTANKPIQARPEWAYLLYAALLEKGPIEFAKKVHEDKITPVSQFLTTDKGQLSWTINLLGDMSEKAFVSVLDKQKTFFLRSENVSLNIDRCEKEFIADTDEFFFRAVGCSRQHTLKFCTATAFKSQGKYRILPTEQLLIQSLVKQWNGCFPECPIEDGDNEGIHTLTAGLRIQRVDLDNDIYHIKQGKIPGFVGSLRIGNYLEGFHRKLADVLLLFSGYAGIGIKTALGMGGVQHIIVS